MAVKDWTEADDAQLRQLWGEGHSTAEIGRRMSRSKSSICGRAHRKRLPPRPSPVFTGPVRLTDQQDVVLRGLVAQGYTRQQITKHMKLSEGVVRGAMRRLGIGAANPLQSRSDGVRPLLARGAAALTRAQESTERLRAEAFRRHAQPGGETGAPSGAAHPIPASAGDPVRPGRAEACGVVAGLDVSSQTLPTAVQKPPSAFSVMGGACRWPLWNDATPREERRFCQAPRAHGAYCAEHGARAYTRRFEEPAEDPHRVTRSTFAWGGRAA